MRSKFRTDVGEVEIIRAMNKHGAAQRFETEPADKDAIFDSLTVLEPIGEKVVNPLNYSAKGK